MIKAPAIPFLEYLDWLLKRQPRGQSVTVGICTAHASARVIIMPDLQTVSHITNTSIRMVAPRLLRLLDPQSPKPVFEERRDDVITGLKSSYKVQLTVIMGKGITGINYIHCHGNCRSLE